MNFAWQWMMRSLKSISSCICEEALEDSVDVLKEAQNMEIDSEGMVTALLGEVNNALRKARGEA